MKVYRGVSELLRARAQLPEVGWLFVDKSFDVTSPIDISTKNFSIAENDVEEIAAEKSHATWLEIPTFLDLVELVLAKDPHATHDQIIEAAIYYLNNDTFL